MFTLMQNSGFGEFIAENMQTFWGFTGFANAVVSPAIEFKQEGHITGIGARMFNIAGPVIVFGTVTSVLYGLILWVFQLV